jgi:hypothetical protein
MIFFFKEVETKKNQFICVLSWKEWYILATSTFYSYVIKAHFS